jgi:hypothetical protein
MMPVGFIANKKDLSLKLEALENAAGDTGVIVFQADEEHLTTENSDLSAFLQQCSISRFLRTHTRKVFAKNTHVSRRSGLVHRIQYGAIFNAKQTAWRKSN